MQFLIAQWLHWLQLFFSRKAVADRLQYMCDRGFTQPFIETQLKENIKAPRHWPLCGEFTGDQWIPRTNGQ